MSMEVIIQVPIAKPAAEIFAASGVPARVIIGLEARDAGTTLVTINEALWPRDAEGVQRALGQTRGWTDFLCCLKAYLQFGVSLRDGRTAADH